MKDHLYALGEREAIRALSGSPTLTIGVLPDDPVAIALMICGILCMMTACVGVYMTLFGIIQNRPSLRARGTTIAVAGVAPLFLGGLVWLVLELARRGTVTELALISIAASLVVISATILFGARARGR